MLYPALLFGVVLIRRAALVVPAASRPVCLTPFRLGKLSCCCVVDVRLLQVHSPWILIASGLDGWMRNRPLCRWIASRGQLGDSPDCRDADRVGRLTVYESHVEFADGCCGVVWTVGSLLQTLLQATWLMSGARLDVLPRLPLPCLSNSASPQTSLVNVTGLCAE